MADLDTEARPNAEINAPYNKPHGSSPKKVQK